MPEPDANVSDDYRFCARPPMDRLRYVTRYEVVPVIPGGASCHFVRCRG